MRKQTSSIKHFGLSSAGAARAVEILSRGGAGILPTDTIYGIACSAFFPKTVARIYRLRRRDPKKPMIILAASRDDIKKFGIVLGAAEDKILAGIWPGRVSVIFRVSSRSGAALKRFRYLHRGTATFAFRIPKTAWLRKLLMETGPLVAPSANFEGERPAKTVREARRYFGNRVDFYWDKGRLDAASSTLIKIEKGKVVVLRPGAGRIPRRLLL